jgi:dextranase
VSLWQLEHQIDEVGVDDDGVARFPPQDEGGYGVEAGGAATALDVLADPLARPRYGFVADYSPGRDPAGVAELARRLHLNAVQFYDWMYRHAQLLPPEDEFADALGRRISLATVRRLAVAVRKVGALSFGYAAVYAVGREAWPQWAEAGLYHADGTPWTLGEDFLWNVDPSDERWLDHFTSELRQAAAAVGFSGFHLDQYGSPKRALRRDGSLVDLARAFPALIDRVASELPGTRLIFNNVNDFPTWTTAQARQDAVYVEVWPPHKRLGHLAALVTKAKGLAPDKGAILAAYLAPYNGDEAGASAAERLLLATVFSHGGTVLLHGEESAALTEAYYVRHRPLNPATLETTRRYYDFAVRYGDLLFDRDTVDVTRTHLGGDNQEVKIEAPVRVSTDCEPGSLWARVLRGSRGLVLSLIDLSGQSEDEWNQPKQTPAQLAGVRLRVERTGDASILFASPEAPATQQLAAATEGNHHVVTVPPFTAWALVWVREDPTVIRHALSEPGASHPLADLEVS